MGMSWKKWIALKFVRILLSIPFLLSTYTYYKTSDLNHPTIYFARVSRNVKILLQESEFSKNFSIVDSPVLGDIVWDKQYFLVEDYYNFGAIQTHQAYNHIIGEKLMAEKGHLTRILRQKDNELQCVDDCFSETFYPLSYELYNEGDIVEFLRIYDRHNEAKMMGEDEGEESCEMLEPGFTWMLKPVSLSGGKGIKILTVPELEKFVNFLKSRDPIKEEGDESEKQLSEDFHNMFDLGVETSEKYLIQKYIHNPLLVEEKKFSIRAYVLVASLSPFRVLLWNDARTATSTKPYTLTVESLSDANTIHLTNVYQQTHAKGQNIKAEQVTIWDLETLNQYLLEQGIVDSLEWGQETFLEEQVRKISDHVLRTWYEHVEEDVKKYNFFGLYGLDLLLDEDLNVHLTEVQKGCGMSIANEVKLKVVKPLVHEVFEIVSEIQTSKEVENLESRKNFIWVINDAEQK